MLGRAAFVKGAGAALASLGVRAASAKKKRNKKKGCPTCPSASCPVRFTEAGGGKICSVGSLSPATCTPCTSSGQCRSIAPDFPHCVTAGRAFGDAAPSPLACDGSPPGQCRLAGACIT